MNKQISNERMAAFIQTIIRQVETQLHERSDNILGAWQENIEEAHNNEKDALPPLKLSITATVDIEKCSISTQLSFTAKYTSTVSTPLPDPNQPELPGVEVAQ